MKRISKEVKAIADAHILARKNKSFNPVMIKTKADLITALNNGHTFEKVMDTIEARFCSVTSIMINSIFLHDSKAYIAGVYKGFKLLLQS